MPALIASVSDKEGLPEFARVMQEEFDFDVYASGGTRHKLAEEGLRVIEIADYTRFPEMMDDRVKTLHPKVHGGILGLPSHRPVMEEHGIVRFDLVVVNFYAFRKAVQEELPFGDILKKIDIGGPTLAVGPTKNFGMCAPIVDPSDYDKVIDSYRRYGTLTTGLRLGLAVKSARHVSLFYGAVADYYDSVSTEEADAFLVSLLPQS